MAYAPPTADEVRYLVQQYWRGHQDVSKRANADDGEFVRIKVQETFDRLRNLIRSGVAPNDAENQAMREVTLAD